MTTMPNRAERRKHWSSWKNPFSGMTWWQRYEILRPLDADVRAKRVRKRFNLEEIVE